MWSPPDQFSLFERPNCYEHRLRADALGRREVVGAQCASALEVGKHRKLR
jgi:hypothetical protein